MFSKKSISVFVATIFLLIFAQSCRKDKDSKVEAEAVPSPTLNAEISPEIKAQPTPEVPVAPVDPLAEFDPVKSARFTDTAKFLAGIKVEDTSAIASLQKTQVWINHATGFENSWAQLEAQQLSKVRRWADAELKSMNESDRPLFYPFSGPDFLYAYSFFPKSSDYILMGLEPVGHFPDLETIPEPQVAANLQWINNSLSAILNLSFFRTNAMKVDLAEKGVLPILFVFLARTNNQILDVQYIGVDKNAKMQNLEDSKNNLNLEVIPGVKISFLPLGETEPRTLYYFSLDLSDSGLEKTPQFREFVQQFDQPITYLKAASYLMHYENFSAIRKLILSQSISLVQDDSGIPVKYFESNQWELKFYGNYTRPIDLFKNMDQPDLRNIYKTDQTIKPLDFGIGYKFQVNESNLMLAIPKKLPPSQPEKTPNL